MSVRPIVGVSPDRGFADAIAGALYTVGPISLQRSLHAIDEGDLQHALVVVHVRGEVVGELATFLPRFAGDCRVIVILPRAGLGTLVELMAGSQRVVGILVEEDFESRALAALAKRALTGDVFGLDKHVLPGAHVYTDVVSDHESKVETTGRIFQVVSESVPPAHHAAIEQCIDEMMVNALYAAPVDDQGKRVFAGISPKTRLGLRIPQEVVVQYACDGHRFAISVRDGFGSLPRQTVFNVLYKCLHDDQSVDTKASGAGVGLFLMVQSCSSVTWNVIPGVATEVTCTFDLAAPRAHLKELAFFLEPSDVTGKLPTGATKRLSRRVLRMVRRHRIDAPATAKYARYAVLATAFAALMLVAYAIYARVTAVAKTARVEVVVTPKGATVELEGKPLGAASDGTLSLGDLEIGRAYSVGAHLDGYQPQQTVVQPHDGTNRVTLELQPVAATIELDSDPPGATVVLDGKPMGGTPIALTTLPPSTKVTLVLARRGYRDAKIEVVVPARGASIKIAQKLTPSDDFVKIHLESTPSGAQVLVLTPGAPALERTYTPAEVVVEAGKPQRFLLVMPGYAPLEIPELTPARGQPVIEKRGELEAGRNIHVEAAIDGKVTVAGAPHCKDVGTPMDCPLAPGASYEVEFIGVNGVKQTRTVPLEMSNATVKFNER